MSQYLTPEEFDKDLRLGDIIKGFPQSTPVFKDFINEPEIFTINIVPQPLFAVLTPCCSIEKEVVTVTPLIKVKRDYFKNTYFAEDLTRLNRPIPLDKLFSPEQLDDMSPEKKAQAQKGGSFYENYIYSGTENLPDYILKMGKDDFVEAKYYMINFKNTFTINSKIITRGNAYPKLHQLTISARGELREKLGAYYSRVAPEDDKII